MMNDDDDCAEDDGNDDDDEEYGDDDGQVHRGVRSRGRHSEDGRPKK